MPEACVICGGIDTKYSHCWKCGEAICHLCTDAKATCPCVKSSTLKKIHEIMEDAARCKNIACAHVLRDFAFGIGKIALQLGCLTEEDYAELVVRYR